MFTSKRNRKGAVLQILLSISLTMLIASTAFLFANMQRGFQASVLMSVKADYQIESAIIMLLQKIRSGETPTDDAPALQRHIAPRIELTINCQPISPETWLFKANVEGPVIQHNITAIGNLSNPDRITYQ